MAGVEDDDVSSSEPAEDLWNIAITTKGDSSSNVPLKSSNEILTELFGAFNAEPPKSILASGDDSENGSKVKKHKKKHKKDKKHKKKSRNKRRLSGEQDNSSVGCSSDSENDHEKRREKKHKSKKRHHTKSSDMDSAEELKPKKRPRHSKSPPPVMSKEPVCDTEKDSKKQDLEESPVEIIIKKELNGNADVETPEVLINTPAPCPSPPSLPAPKKEDLEESSVFENIKFVEGGDEKAEKTKPAMGKIVIKDLKFSSVYEATVKEVEEQAKAKAEKYEEGELSDSSSLKTSSVLTDEPCNNAPSLGSEGGEAVEPSIKLDEDPKETTKRSHSKEKVSSRHKKSRHRSRSRSRSKGHDHKSRDKDRHNRHKDKDREKEKDKEKERDRHRERDKDKHKDKDRGRDRSRDKEREKERDQERDKEKLRDRDRKDKDHKDRRRGRSRSRSPRSNRNRSSSRNRRRHSRERRRSRSRSRDHKRPDHIDKKKLLEIARRNAMNMLQAGILPPSITGKSTAAPPSAAAAPVVKPEKNAAKTVDELTEYCKELSKRENMGELSSLSGSDDSDSEKPFHHPFQVKDRPSFISMNIKNAVQLPLKTLQERTVEQSHLRIQFPVSSGQQHRKTESEWVPVAPPKKTEERKPTALKAIEAPKPVDSPSNTSTEVIDIGTLVSQRLAAIRKKHDSEQSQYIDPMHGWNNALPGQYTGDTGLRLLTPQQLASGAQAWARKDQLQTAAPVRSGMGMTLLQKMGWRPGEGLGKNKEGCQEPLQLEVKMDRKGLVAAEEVRSRRPPPTVSQPRTPKANPVTLEGKHPVSLLTEYCSKRHFGAPHFDLCLETGPDHKKDFLFKVRVNGLEYTPGTASPNKKQAKAEAASVCLKALGVLIS